MKTILSDSCDTEDCCSLRTKAFGKLQFVVITRDQGGGGGEYDMLQSTPVSQSVVSSAHKLASRNCGTAVGGGGGGYLGR